LLPDLAGHGSIGINADRFIQPIGGTNLTPSASDLGAHDFLALFAGSPCRVLFAAAMNIHFEVKFNDKIEVDIGADTRYRRMSAYGYKRKFQPPPRHVRLSPNKRHSLADVRYRADFVRFTPESRRGSGRSRESEVDPERTVALPVGERIPMH
jgi:hypothetical protein